MLKLRTLLLSNYLYYSLTVIALIYSILITNFGVYKSKYNGNENEIIGYIHHFKIDGNHLQIELISDETIMVNYYFKTEIEKNNYQIKLGDIVLIKGEMKKPSSNRVFNLFNYQQYLYYQNIHYLFRAEKIVKIKDNYQLRYKIKQMIINRIEKNPNSSSYLKIFLLGNKDNLNSEVVNSYQTNGISHLLAISGLHVSFLAITILYILKKIKVKELLRYLIIFLFLLLYLFLTDFTGSVLRATVFFILLSINKLFYFHIKTINILLLTLFLLLMINPFLIYDISFQFSFIISFYLILGQLLINKVSSYLGKLLVVSIIAFLASIPICSNYFFQVNLLSPLFNLLFVPYVTFILFPSAFLTFIFPFLDSIYIVLIKLMEFLSLWSSQIKVGILILAKPHYLLIISYYVIITIGLIKIDQNRYLYIILLIILLSYHVNINYFICDPYLVFIDVGQGDSILINLPYGKGTILVDTGGEVNYPKESWEQPQKTYSLGQDTIIPYLKSLGIKKIDYLILTHGHYDHLGEAKNIVFNFKVNYIVFNGVSITPIEINLINELKKIKSNILMVKAGDSINLNGYLFYILNPSLNFNPNDNSIVISTVLNQHKILLTGDITSTIEYKLINTYNLLKVDILKLGHHGSISSTGNIFLDTVNPKYGVISVGLNNRFNHPSPVIIEKLKQRNIKTFLTSKHGSIRFNCKENEVTIHTTIAYDNLGH